MTSAGDARRLVGVYGFAIATGCLQSFTFDQGNPFVYLISRQGTLSGLRCVNDGVNGHLEGFTASPAAGDAFTTNHLVFGRQVNTRRLVPVSFDSGTLAAPADPAALALGSDITGCSSPSPPSDRAALAVARSNGSAVSPEVPDSEPEVHTFPRKQSQTAADLDAGVAIEAKRRERRRRSEPGASGLAGAPQRGPTHCRAKRVGADRSEAESGDEEATSLEQRDGPQAVFQVVLHGPGGEDGDLVGGRRTPVRRGRRQSAAEDVLQRRERRPGEMARRPGRQDRQSTPPSSRSKATRASSVRRSARSASSSGRTPRRRAPSRRTPARRGVPGRWPASGARPRACGRAAAWARGRA